MPKMNYMTEERYTHKLRMSGVDFRKHFGLTTRVLIANVLIKQFVILDLVIQNFATNAENNQRCGINFIMNITKNKAV